MDMEFLIESSLKELDDNHLDSIGVVREFPIVLLKNYNNFIRDQLNNQGIYIEDIHYDPK